MMKKLSLFLVMLMMNITLFAQKKWNVDPYHTKLTFSTVHLGISDVEGWFEDFDITMYSDKEDFSDARFELTVKVKSINTAVQMRDDHLRSADFFEIETYATMTFRSTAIHKMWTNRYKLTGELTMHGVTKTVTMDLWYRGTITNPQSNATTAGFQLTGTLKRSDFNIGKDFPNAMISDKVEIKADGEFILEK